MGRSCADRVGGYCFWTAKGGLVKKCFGCIAAEQRIAELEQQIEEGEDHSRRVQTELRDLITRRRQMKQIGDTCEYELRTRPLRVWESGCGQSGTWDNPPLHEWCGPKMEGWEYCPWCGSKIVELDEPHPHDNSIYDRMD